MKSIEKYFYILALKTVKNLTVETWSQSALIAWESPIEEKSCTASYHLSLNTTNDNADNENNHILTRFNHYFWTDLEPCITYYGHILAIDSAGTKGIPVLFNITTDSAISTYTHYCLI